MFNYHPSVKLAPFDKTKETRQEFVKRSNEFVRAGAKKQEPAKTVIAKKMTLMEALNNDSHNKRHEAQKIIDSQMK